MCVYIPSIKTGENPPKKWLRVLTVSVIYLRQICYFIMKKTPE
jgi:hypothetical protein